MFCRCVGFRNWRAELEEASMEQKCNEILCYQGINSAEMTIHLIHCASSVQECDAKVTFLCWEAHTRRGSHDVPSG